MPINVLGNSSNNSEHKLHTSVSVQKPYLRIIYIEINIEHNIDLKNQYRIKNLPDPVSIREAASKNYADNLFNDPSIVKNNAHVDFIDKNLNNVHSIKLNSFPTLEEHFTPKFYVDQAISEGVDDSSLLRLDLDEKLNLDEQDSIFLNSTLTTPKTIIELPTKSYIDSLHEENERSRRALGIDFYDESNELVKYNHGNDFNDNKLTNIDSIRVKRSPTEDN